MSAGARRPRKRPPEPCPRAEECASQKTGWRYGRALAKRAAQAPKFHERGNGRGRTDRLGPVPPSRRKPGPTSWRLHAARWTPALPGMLVWVRAAFIAVAGSSPSSAVRVGRRRPLGSLEAANGRAGGPGFRRGCLCGLRGGVHRCRRQFRRIYRLGCVSCKGVAGVRNLKLKLNEFSLLHQRSMTCSLQICCRIFGPRAGPNRGLCFAGPPFVVDRGVSAPRGGFRAQHRYDPRSSACNGRRLQWLN